MYAGDEIYDDEITSGFYAPIERERTHQQAHNESPAHRTHPGQFGCPFCKAREHKMNVDVKDALRFAVVRREVAEDDYAAEEYRWATMDVDRELGFGSRFWRACETRQAIEKAMIDARMAAMIEGDAYGLINLFDPGEGDDDATERIIAVARFAR